MASTGVKEVRTHQMSFMAIAVLVGVSGITGALLESKGIEKPAEATPSVANTVVTPQGKVTSVPKGQ